ncbi:hypothetical protein [Krasilnikovia sp. MM14-A1004]|uniref:hypothetical protein n=1 Tax=Krasilnikovia sp. MM14-A1004 TaxID=3373541 RepID=UPI00399CE5A3
MRARKLQSDHVQAAKAGLRAWADHNAIPLVDIFEMSGSVIDEPDFGQTIWLFFETDAQVTQFKSDGTTARVQDAFLKILRDGGYPDQWLAVVTFDADSRERVDREYEGSYFNYFR